MFINAKFSSIIYNEFGNFIHSSGAHLQKRETNEHNGAVVNRWNLISIVKLSLFWITCRFVFYFDSFCVFFASNIRLDKSLTKFVNYLLTSSASSDS